MITGIIKTKTFAECSYRFDPDIHLSEGVTVRRTINALPYEISNIGENAEKVFYGNIFSRIFVEKPDHGVEYLSASDTMVAEIGSGKYISKKQSEQLKYLMLKRDWIIVTCSGTLGKVAYTNGLFENKLVTHDLIRIVPNDNKVLRGCIYAFLSSKYGYHQITQSQFGGVVKHINDEQTKSIKVPVFPKIIQEETDSLIRLSSSQREEATMCLNEAVKYFDSLYSINQDITKTFSLRLKQLKLGIAAYNNNIEVDEFINKYEDNSIQLKDITSKIFAPPLFKHIYLDKDNGYPFMTGSELTQFNLRYYRWLSPRGVKDINDYVVKKGTLLLYKSGTTDGGILGNVFITDKKLDGCCLSDHVIRIVFNDEKMAYWAFAFLKSKGAVRMLQRLATGTMIPFITPERISELLIPAPDENYNRIIDLVERYIDLNSQSKANETKAIELVEAEIEKWNK